jgi:hypothetical protein
MIENEKGDEYDDVIYPSTPLWVLLYVLKLIDLTVQE